MKKIVKSVGRATVLLLAFVLSCIIGTQNASADITNSMIPDDAVQYNGHYYKIHKEAMSLSGANSYCKETGGHLVTITDGSEQAFVESLFSNPSYDAYWMGATVSGGEWRWITGEEFSYSNWYPGEPNKSEDGMVLQIFSTNRYTIGTWDDTWNNGDNAGGIQTEGFICEWDGPEVCEDDEVIMDTTSFTLAYGSSKTLKATGPHLIMWKSSNPKVATVSKTGKVTAKKPGKATITAYSKSDPNNKATCKVTVKYKLTYKMDGGKNSSKNPTWYTGTVKLNNPNKRTGCDFKGWYSDPKFKKRVKTVKNKNMTLYAKWDWHSYYIDFIKNGGSGKSYSQTCRYGKEFSLPACKYTRKGYDFRGWNTKANGSGKVFLDKAKFKNLTSVDGKTIKLYAQWKPKKYSITYKVKSGAKHSNKTSYTIVTATFNLKNASCAGYDFKGWFSDSSFKKPITSIKKGSTGNKTIYSKWAAHKYTVKFDANGGKGKMANKGPWSYGLDYKLPKNSFTKDDFVFTGWNTKSDGSGKAFGDGAAVCDLVTKDGGSITLYAQWKMAFTPRTKLDGLKNSNYMKRANELVGSGNGMPNCTTYALARAFEITNYDYENNPKYVPPFWVDGHGNAEYWWENNNKSKNPYPTGQKAKVGAIAVWKGNMGHVAIVEAIDSEGHVYYSHSSYGGFSYTPKHPYPGSKEDNDSNFHCEAFFTPQEEAEYLLNRQLLGYIYLID